ncbi:Plant UBX domain-containing protein 1 [Rhynchospora pubera]|uniref:Plant UBX domain-containing protein 1 n=1 Tax=Rhynchospora pubera TaxID=906938 RepID=A0AAV8D4U3_9POAL|nr:Plant UBX domain-containing protein 1 [Rhynchospora pubera]
MDEQPAKKLKRYQFPLDISQDQLSAVAEELGHEICVFMSSSASTGQTGLPSSNEEEPDDFYDLTPEDYYRLMGNKIGAQSEMLKTRKIREAEAAARRARYTKAVVRVRFPDNYILEANFKPSEKIQDLVDLLLKVIARPDIPFYLYTTPPKERLKDTSKDFYTASFVPGANVYFSYDLPNDSQLNSEETKTGPYLREEIRSLNGLVPIPKQAATVIPEPVPASAPTIMPSADPNPRPAAKKPTKPKWLKL